MSWRHYDSGDFQSPIAKPNMVYDQWDAARHGQRFLFIEPHVDPNATVAPLAPITVVVNWMVGIKKQGTRA